METGPPALLTRFPVLGTRSLDEARDAVTRIYLEHELTAPTDHLEMTLNAVTDRHFTLGYLTYRSAAKLVMPATEDNYHVNLTVAGRTDADRTDGGRASTHGGRSGIVLAPDQRNTVRWSPDAEQLILKIPRRSLENHLGDLLGRPVNDVVDFDFGLDLSTAQGTTLLASVEFLARELDRPGGLADLPLAREQFEAFVMTQLLHAGRHQYSDDLRAPAEPLRHGRLQPVLDYMEQHADEPLTPQELARVGCMSVRTLHASFQQALGESPMSHLRRIRLDHVRAELLRSDPSVTLVTDVAVRWGFLHQSRFAQQYRERFGELPRDTLRG
ncbi:helix-turn-helix domain-containing protein [Pseudonocardia sp. KRD-184]|uniref:Helix-turn-helix domain-containing protein n=1 Tax=Pseudonocardia oceani TaxID=2792013 RepID=A0ABS6U4L3_9PSEU|nr:helix-turn-helix domain-containing protein [Pseudonocardia oceani]MBW0091625.1 helix-turn-helix domain-containing protein [Pseudonocardia oceani]MBW0099315.1 helix-turn-helix domain-containing protein [Pseudonocardia oceani]MBW0111845.1 helix-turn-helix domain-containing protein [Pseudonocardia oceani]MBW0125441.1 helix-turn-helix domain-containing protein [Pseudonocardia oceani]MBW0126913.1 helix-turn-helix domain-containing protein [Pseudonocardia oceani]